MNLFDQKFPGSAILYIALTLIGGISAVWAGVALGRTLA
jgi:fluoride ion exporter CrcB/FEX